METIQLVATTQPTIKVHSMARGDFEKARESLKYPNEIVHKDLKPRFMDIPVDQLVALESQRETSSTWAQNRLNNQHGFDIIACGALSVALDPNDGIYYVYDGCGRLLQAQLNMAPATLPCLVFDIPKELAAFYFDYTQSEGRRSLSPEVIFVNRAYSGNADALKWRDLLVELECYIKGQTNYAIPHPQPINQPEIKYRALTVGYDLSGQDVALMKEARDIIWDAYIATPFKCNIIRQDLFWGMILFLKTYPSARKNGFNKALRQFMSYTAIGQNQKDINWKKDGGNLHNQEALSTAIGLYNAFHQSSFWKASFNSVAPKYQLDDMIKK